MTIAQAVKTEAVAAGGGRTPRVFWIDFAKAFGIILVCLGHTIGGLRIDRIGADLEFYNFLRALIYTFHMPLFFFLSGVLTGFRPSTSVGGFIRSSVVGLILPYVLWSVVFVFVQNAFSGAVNAATPYSDLAQMWWKPIGLFWFFYALFVARAVYFVAMALFGRSGMTAAFMAFAALYGLSFAGLTDFNSILMGGSFFGLGVLAAPLLSRAPDRRVLIAALLAATAAWAVLAVATLDPATPRPLWVAAAIAGIAMTVAASRLVPAPNGSVLGGLALIGQASMAIYVAHVMFSATVRAVLYKAGVYDATLHVVLATAAGVIGPVVLFVLANRAGLAPFVGFGSTQKSLYGAPLFGRVG
ncbi:acyltransferase family protein [Blastochloris viridis]|uniref:Acyltransferase/acetyltransferase n=1 Tax=Blastochloris viridis TaxID=1079 RepID=A0A0H5B6M8_BLAVI|nr:acyltransferase family protein [Blastochloris viridis]ALK08890.1 Acyltransferase family protein [Blastochloris viridis]BAR97807.1 acyltransferase/acetyltransferase [Blastochloris viridis]CUU41551.1 putative membrane protein [Blastochloris viridis]